MGRLTRPHARYLVCLTGGAAMKLVLVIVAGLAAAAQVSAQEPQAAVVVDPVEMRVFAETTPILGRLVAATRSVVAARTPGVVATVAVEVGDRVRAGDELARIDATRAAIDQRVAVAAVEQARADLDAAAADLDLADQALERVSRLRGSGAFSQGAFDDRLAERTRAESRRGAALARLTSAEAALAQAEYDLTHAVTRAPFDGVVIDRTAQPGAYLSVGAAVATLLDVDDYEIEADIPTEIVAGLAIGAEVEAVFGAETTAPATVRAVIPEEAVTTRTRPVRFDVTLNGALGALAAGQSVTLRMPTAEARPALTVSKDAVSQTPRGWTVFVAVDGKAEPRIVEIGQPVGDRLEVLGGLAEGDLVVVRGNERLRPGQSIAARFANGEPAGEG
ncbi:MAG: efflux RND transporter periplasmic adaptor subunit [Rhodobacteraceae bacterium]|nr:MAG: efflux RND transporter periplasmic adaptor subunit [Paracoccaceae bacterium]